MQGHGELDGKVQSIEIHIGRWLGLGDKVVTISADKFEHLADQIRLRLLGDEISSSPDATTKVGRKVITASE